MGFRNMKHELNGFSTLSKHTNGRKVGNPGQMYWILLKSR